MLVQSRQGKRHEKHKINPGTRHICLPSLNPILANSKKKKGYEGDRPNVCH